MTTVDFSQGGQTVSNDPEEEPLAQVFGTTTVPLVHISAVARRFYASHSDDYDQLVMFANFTHAMGGAFAYEVSPKNDVEGIGVETYDSARLFGSASRLQSFVNLNRLNLYPSDPATNISGLGTNNTLDVIGQEAGHRWLAFTKYDSGNGASDDILGRDKAHWSFFLDSDASDMEGNNWQDNGNGTFTSNEATARYGPLDQYLMGLRSTAETPDFFFIDNPSFVNCPVYDSDVGERSCPPRVGVTVTGQRQNISVHEIVAAEGSRQPESGFSEVNPSTTWKQAFILLVKTATAPSTDLTKIGNIRNAWVPYFKSAVSNLAQVDTLLPGGEPSIQFSAGNFSVSESAGSTNITVTRTGSTAEAVTVDYATSNGTATAGSDYTSTSGTLTFNARESSKTFPVSIANDTYDENDETVNLTLTNPTGGAVLGSQSSATLTITEDDIGGVLQFSAAAYSVNETGGSITITVSRSGGSASNVAVAYATGNGSASAGSDYTATSGTLTFGAGETSKTFAVPIANDGLAEGNETINLSLSNPTGGATLGALAAAVLTIVDDEIAINFSSANFTVAESSKTATINLSRSGPTTAAVSVDYATSDGTATAGADYSSRTGTIIFAAGQANRTFTIPIINDTLDENSETVNLTLSNPTGGAQLGTQNTALLTITD
ncbi:MAG TPA: Calx-beta domain-containing protein, partial [Candidatus Binatia bacterium]|nr:Calx-beta domain-containing protein [Candidatus Binatia bacterium]